jgi:hypothetical protein
MEKKHDRKTDLILSDIANRAKLAVSHMPGYSDSPPFHKHSSLLYRTLSRSKKQPLFLYQSHLQQSPSIKGII